MMRIPLSVLVEVTVYKKSKTKSKKILNWASKDINKNCLHAVESVVSPFDVILVVADHKHVYQQMRE